jgi:hypothetical protein
MASTMSLQSTVGIARTGAKSLRATVPEGIVVFLELSEGDKLEWKMQIDASTGERYALVRKARATSRPDEGARRTTKYTLKPKNR